MRLLQGRAIGQESDHRRTLAMTDRVAETREPALRVWTPHPQVAFGRRDRNCDGYERAVDAAERRGFTAIEREVGGRAVAYTGNTVAFALAEPVEDHRTGIQARYERLLDALETALADCGVETRRGEPANSFCPGSHSLQVADGKIAGVAQRVRQDLAVVAGLVVIRDGDVIADVLDPVYGALAVPFDPESVGSVATAGGPADPKAVIRAIESAFAGNREPTVTPLRET